MECLIDEHPELFPDAAAAEQFKNILENRVGEYVAYLENRPAYYGTVELAGMSAGDSTLIEAHIGPTAVAYMKLLSRWSVRQ